MATEKPKVVMAGNWAAATLQGDVNTNLANIMNFLSNLPQGRDETAKVFEGTDQMNNKICAIFYKQ